MALVITIAGIIGFWVYKNAGKMSDFRMAKVGGGGIEMVGMSFNRRMVNKIKIPEGVMVWVPGGYGWYRSEKINQLLIDEKKIELWSQILFYNFGFDANLIETNEFNYWLVLEKWGWYPWIRYRLNSGEWLVKEDEILEVQAGQSLIDKMMQRDMADSDILENTARLMVYNASGENGLAAFVGRNLERVGLTVTGWENAETDNMGCELRIPEGWGNEQIDQILVKYFSECERKTEIDLPAGEAEFYFGQKYAQMLNYRSYNSVLEN